ncbi:phosphoadenylyl-sulfate reductase [Aestuariibacter salexigens]|uniref:phosphoadenylyl-sulfate reductase n=1 Tax=Aestuariibacter salexigens TaxID=226010 RepID=UPI00146FC02A|nr:phosphoadenylyl-sulfate reductase [Aestuariibacter salexigens]
MSEIARFEAKGLKVFMTSSFQTQSMVLLHLISKINRDIPIFMLDTGFLFPETHLFAEEVARTLKLNLIKVKPNHTYKELMAGSKFLYAENSDLCCMRNKVEPLRETYKGYNVWLSGVRADQSNIRAGKKRIEENSDGIIRYHPLLNWDSKSIYLYRKQFELPEHPLEKDGFLSVGCMPCTSKYVDDFSTELRKGRWSGQNKQECGLHTHL